MAKIPCALFLLDWKPLLWSTREEFFFQLSRKLAGRGIQPILVVSEEPARGVLSRFEEAGARVVTCSYDAGRVQYWSEIRKIAREHRVLLAQIRFFDYFSAVPWMCRLAGIRNVVLTEANSGEWNGTGIKAALVRLRTRVMCAPLRRAIAISRFIQKRLIDSGIPSSKTLVVYNGVNTSSFHPDPEARSRVRQERGAGAGTIVLLFAAFLKAWKRPDLALKVCAELARRGADVQLWMAGDGVLKEQLQSQAKDQGIQERVRWLGHQAEIQLYMSAADVLLHTATGEAFGNVLIEALACGIPVVATHSGAAPELITEECGALVARGPSEVSDFAGAIQATVASQKRYRMMSEAGVRRAAEFTVERSVAGTLAVYEALLAQEP